MGYMSTTTTALLTFDEFERLPDKPGKRELLEGELIELPSAELRHNPISERIFLRLHGAVIDAHSRGEAADLGKVHHEMGYKLPNDGYVQPDVSVTHAAQEQGKYYGGAPAIAIEIVSPSNTAEMMETKVELYFRYGAREVWRVFPKARHIVVHIGLTSRTIREDETLTTPLLAGLALTCAKSWNS
jgi:Uma2 family endonuclease